MRRQLKLIQIEVLSKNIITYPTSMHNLEMVLNFEETKYKS